MSRNRFTVFAVLLTLLGSLMLTGCHSDQSLAADATKQFIEATKGGDLNAVKATLTKAAQEKWNPAMGSMMQQSKIVEYTVGDAVITGDTASVPVTIKDDKGQSSDSKINLRKEDGKWRVFSIAFSSKGISLTIDFEHPETLMNQFMKAIGDGFKSMQKGMSGGK